MEDFYLNIDAFINTSFHEGIPMSILEAMSYGKPVVAPNVGGIHEIFQNGRSGFLVDGRNPFKYAKRCIELASDRLLYEKMANSSRKRVINNFSMETMVASYVKIYRRSMLSIS